MPSYTLIMLLGAGPVVIALWISAGWQIYQTRKTTRAVSTNPGAAGSKRLQDEPKGGASWLPSRSESDAARAEIRDLRTELRGDISRLRTELTGDIGRSRAGLEGDVARLRTELRGDINRLRLELKHDLAAQDAKLAAINLRLDNIIDRLPSRTFVVDSDKA